MQNAFNSYPEIPQPLYQFTTITGKSAGCPAFLLQGRGGKPTL